ncbi:universal stress protein [Lactobacillus alvi]|uniref:Universal stress protein n=1 Tax=Limosilactobacillus alvi TaxID=990412 RepID=A0ABS2EQW5_9LACO|nr:universal stress protein [Limosilactobacillus alvi]MBM6754818.1 universal stress protein [Limosilactobacillus alvi]
MAIDYCFHWGDSGDDDGYSGTIIWSVTDRLLDVPGWTPLFGVSEDFYQDFAVRTKEKLQPYFEKARHQGVNVRAEVIIGSIKTVLAKDFPDQHDVDLIVLGNTGINIVEKMLQGSHTNYLVRHAKADVLVVK